MPSALETLVKILKLEREQGYKNTAVIGGFGAFCENWSQEGHNQARKPEHHQLVEELRNVLQLYERTEARTERHNQVAYMLDRITGRVKPNPEYLPDTPYVPPPSPTAPPSEEKPPEAVAEMPETSPEADPSIQETASEQSLSRQTRPPRRSDRDSSPRRERPSADEG